MKLVIVQWNDSCSLRGTWNNMDVIENQSQPLICRSVGWLLVDKKDYIVLVPHINGDNEQGGGDMTIPKKCIIKTKRIYDEIC